MLDPQNGPLIVFWGLTNIGFMVSQDDPLWDLYLEPYKSAPGAGYGPVLRPEMNDFCNLAHVGNCTFTLKIDIFGPESHIGNNFIGSKMGSLSDPPKRWPQKMSRALTWPPLGRRISSFSSS